MLKIEDNVDVRTLLDMGFIHYKGEYIKQISCNAGICIDLNGVIGIFRNDKCDVIVDQLDLIYDMIKAGMVKKVKEYDYE